MPPRMTTINTTTATITTTGASSGHLFRLIGEEKWDELENCLRLLHDEGDDNSTSILEEPYGDLAPEPVPPDSTLLHVVCSYETVPPTIVQTLLRQAPQLVRVHDELGRNALHIAVMEGSCQPSVVRLLAKAAPQMAREVDYSNSIPTEILAQRIMMQEERNKYRHTHAPTENNNASFLKETLARLWDCVQPLAVACCDENERDWDSPLLHACLKACPNGFPYTLIQRARKQYAHQLQATDSEGNYPLHILANWDPEEDEDDYLWRVAKTFPDAAKATNIHGQLALDVALESGMRGWDTGIAQLLEIYPVPERFGKRMGEYSYLLARAARQERTTLIFEILRNQPAFFNHR